MKITIEELAQKLREGTYEAVIFDMDGTLIDSMWLWKALDIEYLARFGLEFHHSLQTAIEGMSFLETANYFKEQFPIPDSVEQMMQDWNDMAWDKYEHEVFPKEGILEFLRYLREQGIKTGIATSNSQDLTDLVLERTGLREWIDAAHTANDVKRGKPAPDIYLYVAKQLHVAPENCLVFEDVYQGVLAGQNAGMTACSVYDEFSQLDQDRIREQADCSLVRMTELLEYLQED